MSALATGCLKNTIALTNLEISPTEVSLDVGQTQVFTVIGKDQNGVPINFTPSWSVTGEIGEVVSYSENTVIFKALKGGQGTLVVSANGITATTNVNVQISESQVVSFIESYDTYIVNEDAENLSGLYSDPYFLFYQDYEPRTISRAELIVNANNFFLDSDLKLVDWDIIIENEIVTIDVIINDKGNSWDLNRNIKWIVKAFE